MSTISLLAQGTVQQLIPQYAFASTTTPNDQSPPTWSDEREMTYYPPPPSDPPTPEAPYFEAGPSSAIGSLRPVEPPPYCVARIPEHPITYSFSSLGPSSSSMILVPPSGSPDTRPVYHISVGQDPFFPLCSVTSVVRGGMPDGALVGSFMTVHGETKRDPETVCIRECEHPMKVMWTYSKKNSGNIKRYQWYAFNQKRTLEWICQPAYPAASEAICVHPDKPGVVLAKFLPANQFQRRDRPVVGSQLTVMPQGHSFFDDILLSVLIWERNRKKEYYGVH